MDSTNSIFSFVGFVSSLSLPQAANAKVQTSVNILIIVLCAVIIISVVVLILVVKKKDDKK